MRARTAHQIRTAVAGHTVTVLSAELDGNDEVPVKGDPNGRGAARVFGVDNTPYPGGGGAGPALRLSDRSGHTGQMHPSVERVTRTLAALGATRASGRVRTLPDAARTAAAAAEQLGVGVAAIANSLVFCADGAPLLVMASGGHRVDTAKVAAFLGAAEVERATPEFVREHTGFAIGGVAPVGHPAPLRTLVDVELEQYDEVWAAAGHPRTVFPTTYAELLAITGGTPVDVGGD